MTAAATAIATAANIDTRIDTRVDTRVDTSVDTDAAPSIVVCPDCDAVQELPVQSLETAGTVCFRCGAHLPQADAAAPPSQRAPLAQLAQPTQTAQREQRAQREDARSDRALAFTLAAIPLFIAAQVLPLLRIEGHGNRIAVTVWGAAQALYGQHMSFLAALVLFTTAVSPALHLGCAAYLLIAIRGGRMPPAAPVIARVLQAIRPWSQIEILLFGMLVAFGKLAVVFHTVPGAGLPCMVAVLLFDRAVAMSLDPRRLWATATATTVSTESRHRPSSGPSRVAA